MVSVCLHMEGRSGDVVVAPLDEDDVGAPFLNDVVDGVLAVPPVFDDHLLAGGLRTIDTHVQDVVAGAGAVHSETVVPAHPGGLCPGSLHPDCRGVAALVEDGHRARVVVVGSRLRQVVGVGSTVCSV